MIEGSSYYCMSFGLVVLIAVSISIQEHEKLCV